MASSLNRQAKNQARAQATRVRVLPGGPQGAPYRWRTVDGEAWFSPEWYVAVPTKRPLRDYRKRLKRQREVASARLHPRLRSYKPAPGQGPFGIDRGANGAPVRAAYVERALPAPSESQWPDGAFHWHRLPMD